ncbi:mannitol-1-phosphate 5-dehydrogenase [Cryobacterium sp. N19]|uniref:mannitol dehydrogenase family protein n=1 Tax=Cryobacterium sp. N19 TaxID=2048288 RepID=UPI000CE3E845|nr:mannitol-1-phosphate 5-dehydrogenase [Cryobacterium sp. N19]
MPARNAVVFGAGRIARGFVGNLLGLESIGITFVDVSPTAVAALNAAGRYTVHILGAPEKSSVVANVSAIMTNSDELSGKLVEADVVFVSVGGANLPSVGVTIARAIETRLESGHPLNIVVCENWRSAGQVLRSSIESELSALGLDLPHGMLGISESTIMRSAVDATEAQLAADPLAVQSQNYWSLPIDADALVDGFPEIRYVEPVPAFQHALERKLYTYNSGNATISFLGVLKGYELLSEAANDPEIESIVSGVYAEMGEAMVALHGYTVEDQAEYAAKSLRKFQDTAIIDPLSRQVRDPLRKLSRHDRLVGAAMYALDAGVQPNNIAIGIAAALRYRDPSDPSAMRMAELIDTLGAGAALAEIGGIDAASPLIDLVESKAAVVDALSVEARP